MKLKLDASAFEGKMKFPGKYREFDIKSDLEYAIKFTELYKSENDKYIREAKCLEMQIPYVLDELADDDFIVGHMVHGYVGFSSQFGGLYTYYFHEEAVLAALKKLKEQESCTIEFESEILAMVDFWSHEATAKRHAIAFKNMFPQAQVNEGYTFPGAANAGLRVAGMTVDLDKLVRLGVSGLKTHLAANRGNFSNENLYTALQMSIDTITLACDEYIKKIDALPGGQLKTRLSHTKKALLNIRTNKPSSFFEGLQLIWIYSVISDLMNYGRLDVALGDLYVNDIKNGTIIEEDAVNIVLSFYTHLRKICKKHDARVLTGGRGRRNEENADKLAIVIMEASRRFHDIVPQLTFRYYKGCNQDVYNKALKVNAEGCTFPIIYSDETNIPAVMKVYDVSYEEACNYLPFGCGEYVLEGLSTGTPNNGVNLLKALELALHSGYDIMWGQQVGPKTKAIEEITSFDDLFLQFTLQLKPYITYLAWHKSLNYSIAAEQSGYLHYSILMNDCFKNGAALLEGGVRYLNAASEVFGIISAGDSLTAIKKVVYDDKIFTLKQVVDMCDVNFESFDRERKILFDAPKYGNDNDYADEIAIKTFNFIAEETPKAGAKTNLHKYNIVSVNNSMSAEWGYYCAASADGRYEGTPMSNGNGCSIGGDRSGITSLLNSMAKFDASKHVGVIHNVRFSSEMFKNDFEKVKALLTVFYENNGVQTNIACVGVDDLKNAMIHPEEYQNLVVRIGGFSERFVELNEVTQKEILLRTTYE